MFGLTPLATRAYQRALLVEVKNDAWQDFAGTVEPRLQERLFVRTGGLLVAAGLWLQAQYEPMKCSPKARQTGC
jgi:hypothetical protein